MDNDTQTPVTHQVSSPRKSHSGLLGILVVILVILGVVLLVEHHHNTTKVVTPTAQIAPAKVSITSAGFVPATISVKTGQAVVWTNTDSASHVVASDPYSADNALPGLKSTTLSHGQLYSYVFYKTGTFTYHDDLNPYSLKGTVVVR